MNDAHSAGRSAPTLSVVVCAYTLDRWEDLRAAIGSVLAQERPADEVVLVVDHNQALLERAERELTGVRVVPSRGRRGLSGGRNTGVEVAHGDVVAFLDDDATAEPGWTGRLLAPYGDPRVAGVGGFVRPRWSTGRPVWFPAEFDWVVGCSYRGLPERATPVRNFIGANMSFRRTELLAAGGFLGTLGRVGTRPAGCEETEMCLRIAARRPEAVLLYDPAVQVRHRVPEARTHWSYFRSRCYGEGLSKALVARHRGRGSALASERTYLRSTIPRALARNLRGTGRPGALRTVGALSAGVCVTVTGYLVGRVRQWGPRDFFRRPQGGAQLPSEGRS
ncbi:glycosyltransferase family 2 protein [Streptomyces luteolifulvus]|jgi:GT2 family glycosyltransferase|uniref:Glycosyltransferase family 2 protein n=1 Tax=Streptomyces luteolifulvus TaxID=2615112 RepID=A0A6H9V373_9ACTN|nr:glycosyltransferase family 2 protein [Streptomyces luteolifulvus]KAB1146647.1 glycosyltransferase family 2 protein [Streptomyces luteolifulvus]